MQLIYTQCYQKFGYEFFVRKRIERRLWSVIGSHLKTLQKVAME